MKRISCAITQPFFLNQCRVLLFLVDCLFPKFGAKCGKIQKHWQVMAGVTFSHDFCLGSFSQYVVLATLVFAGCLDLEIEQFRKVDAKERPFFCWLEHVGNVNLYPGAVLISEISWRNSVRPIFALAGMESYADELETMLKD